MDRATARIGSRLLSYGLPFLYLLTSIAFYLHTYDSAQVKITIVQMLGTLLIGTWYATMIAEWDTRWKAYLPVVAPLLAVLISGLFSWAHSAYPGPSLDEALRRVFYIHFALIALKEINTVERLKRLTTFLLIATAIATVYGLIQHLDWRFYPATTFFNSNELYIDPFVWRQAFTSRAFSTFGNPNFFGNFLVILMPVTLAMLVKRHGGQAGSVLLFTIATVVMSVLLWQCNRLFAAAGAATWASTFFALGLFAYLFVSIIRFGPLGALFFLITFCVMITESKGAWIGYAAGFVSFLFLALLNFSEMRSETLRRRIVRAGIITLAICIVGVVLDSRRRANSIRFRICTWVSTFEMGKMHPIIGNGIGSFRVLYPAFRRPQIFHIEGKHNTETDHAENEYWEVFQDEGLIGFGIFIWSILTFSILGVRALGRFTDTSSVTEAGKKKQRVIDPRAYYMLGVLSAFWGMLAHNFMDVSLRFVSSGIFLWLLAGLIGAMVVHDPMAATDDQRDALQPVDAVQKAPVWPVAVLWIARLATMGAFVWMALRVWTGFDDAQGPNNGPVGDQLLWTIAWLSMVVTLAGSLWGIYKFAMSAKNPIPLVVLCLTVPALNVFWGYFMADVWHNRGIAFSKEAGRLEAAGDKANAAENWRRALRSYETVVALNPNYIMAFYFMGNVYTDRWLPGDFEHALEQYANVWRIAPNYVQSHHQAGLVYLKKGQDALGRFNMLRQQGRLEEAAGELQEAKKEFGLALSYLGKYHGLDPVFEPNYLHSAQIYLQMADIAKAEGRKSDVEQYYDRAERLCLETLGAWECRKPYHNVLGENWGSTPMVASEHPVVERMLKKYRTGFFGNIVQFWGNQLYHGYPGPHDMNDVAFWANLPLKGYQNRQHVHHTASAWENLGNVRFVRGHLNEAVRAYNMSLKIDGSQIRALKNLANAQQRLGRMRDVERTWNRIRQINPADPDVQRVFHGNAAAHP